MPFFVETRLIASLRGTANFIKYYLLMRRIIVLLVFVCFSIALKAQSLIVTHSGETITAFEVEIGEKSVFYQLENNTNAPFFRISKSEVLVIKKEDGSVLVLNNNEKLSGSDSSKDVEIQIEKIAITIPDTKVVFNMIKVEGMDSLFFIGETEVTQSMWTAVMGIESVTWNKSKGIGETMPAYNIDWYKANEFCVELTRMLDNSGYSFSLPTYSQWLCAARGGKYSRDYTYSGSNESKDVAWYKKNSGGKYHNVKSLKPNELGIYDMSGNVGEWCLDEVTSRQKLLAGGTIDSSYDEIQISSPGSSYTEFKHGFRIIMVVK